MTWIRELVLTFLERLSHNALPTNRKRETLDACITMALPRFNDLGRSVTLSFILFQTQMLFTIISAKMNKKLI